MTVGRRRLGPRGPELSQLSFGTMRLAPSVGDVPAAEFLCRLHDHGVDTHHSSHEYDSYDTYLDALATARATGRRFHHIVKLSDPGFDDARFSPSRLSRALDERRRELGAEEIASLQWLFRTPDAGATEVRVAAFERQVDEIAGWARARLAAGDIGNLSVFPYAPAFADAVLDAGVSDTLATYLNLAELDYRPQLGRVGSFIAIRPLAGARLIPGRRPPADDPLAPGPALAYLNGLTEGVDPLATALAFPLLHPVVATSVLSITSIGHLERAVAATAVVEPDLDRFDEIVNQVERARSEEG